MKPSLYIQTHKKPHIKSGILTLTADTATILVHNGWCANLPDTIQLYLHLESYGSDVELFVHTVKKKHI